MRQKVCFKCNVEQPITEFYRHPMMGDGHLGKCKTCAKEDVRQNRAKRRDYYVEYDKQRSRTAERRANLLQSIAKYPEKEATRRHTNSLVAAGKLKRQPCQVCGSSKAEKHHPDYFLPVYVMWLCRQHHADEHRRLRECEPE